MIIGNHIKEVRKELGLSQTSLAEMVGVERTSLSHIERGVWNPSVSTMIAISTALRKQLGEIFFNPDIPRDSH
jgi:putative transcriptional regulator